MTPNTPNAAPGRAKDWKAILCPALFEPILSEWLDEDSAKAAARKVAAAMYDRLTAAENDRTSGRVTDETTLRDWLSLLGQNTDDRMDENDGWGDLVDRLKSRDDQLYGKIKRALEAALSHATPEICGRCGKPRSAECGDDFIPMAHAAVTVAGGDDEISAGNAPPHKVVGRYRSIPSNHNLVQPVAEAVAWAVLDTKNGNYFCTAAGSREQAERERCEYVRLYGRTDRFIIEPLYRTAATRGGEEGK